MRKVFSSQRLENVEAVAELLRSEGIAVKITHGRSYRGHRRGSFSYDSRRTPEELPSVWIVHSEDQPRGRQLLRDLGLLDSTRNPGAGDLPHGRQNDTAGGKAGPFNARRIRLGLLGLTVIGIGLVAFVLRKHDTAERGPNPEVPAAAPALPPLIPEAITELQVYRADVPTALARLLLADALARRKPTRACLSVDGQDPSPALLQAVQTTTPARLLPASACPDRGATTIAVRDYMTDGSGSGEVTLQTGDNPPRYIRVRRENTTWVILGAR